MSRIRPEYLDAETPDLSVAADILVREEPDEEDEDEEGVRAVCVLSESSRLCST